MRARVAAISLALCWSCGSTPPTPAPRELASDPVAVIDAGAAIPDPDPKPELLDQVQSLVRRLCECAQPQCTETRYVAFRDGIEGRSLSGWRPRRKRELHVMRARGEDCNLSMLTGGDTALLELAREAFLDSFAARAPVLLTELYNAAVARAESGEPLPDSSQPVPDKGSCCDWSDGLCQPDPALWMDSPWAELGFSVRESQAFSYQFSRTGDDVTVRAFGDLDCDGEYSTYELRGDVTSEPHPQIRITERLE